MSIAFLFPGQGSQVPGMLHELPDHPVIHQTIAEAGEILGMDVLRLDTEEKLQSTVSVQLCLLVAEVAAARVLLEEGVKPEMAAGHSVGAFAAAVIAGAMDFPSALTTVKRRAELMEAAYPEGYGMGVVTGLKQDKVLKLTGDAFSEDQPVFPANLNAEDQVTLAGDMRCIEYVLERAKQEGARKAFLLPVSVPSHCELLHEVSQELAGELYKIPFKNPSIPCLSNSTARALRRGEDIRHDLAVSIARSVKWHEATLLMKEMGATLFLEMPPGRVLTDLAGAALPSVRSLSLSESGIKSAVLLGKRYRNG
ncbi:malonate decarboxylase epsilon subunit [Fictibacillus enclensis]|uniref:Malonyl CoA-acyl carrier protein transacylase n=1 Tax=Fictibacillus enclensis TaxID=1017270 RepID=A0A0V8JBZ0_9BACL|nr:malonate decarboxylase subunit epsilon [Fictibacillus enclensis]KSU84515.1 malonate decarboxylase subunit epsilon [Fictibacillus enclensis]SCB80775.1 malonate decarboxylase epsilon subunit [Fictibacillus enclensis]